jgi:hypothetical protein
MSNSWIYRPDYTYLGITAYTVECPVCKCRQSYIGDIPPKRCYLCDSVNYKEETNDGREEM